MQVWLQEHAWTLEDKHVLRSLWDEKSGTNTAIQNEPIFCFELAMKAFYWSGLVYDCGSMVIPNRPLLAQTVSHTPCTRSSPSNLLEPIPNGA